jgi:hypothetical protein
MRDEKICFMVMIMIAVITGMPFGIRVWMGNGRRKRVFIVSKVVVVFWG